MAKQNSDYMGMQAQLDEILRRLQSDDIELQEAIELHKKGKELVDQLTDVSKRGRKYHH
jgi:exodeoxyribonuclease VII small subunit